LRFGSTLDWCCVFDLTGEKSDKSMPWSSFQLWWISTRTRVRMKDKLFRHSSDKSRGNFDPDSPTNLSPQISTDTRISILTIPFYRAYRTEQFAAPWPTRCHTTKMLCCLCFIDLNGMLFNRDA
jgi:hypothetical protein